MFFTILGVRGGLPAYAAAPRGEHPELPAALSADRLVLCHGPNLTLDNPSVNPHFRNMKISPEYCECGCPAAAHLDVTHPETRGGPCLKCSCNQYRFDPYLETGPDGQPITSFGMGDTETTEER